MARPVETERTVPSIRLEAADAISIRVTKRIGKFFKIEITSGCKIKELRKTWSNFIALHKLVQKETASVFQLPRKPPALLQARNPELRDSLGKALTEYLQMLVQFQPLPKAVCEFLELDVENKTSESGGSIYGGRHFPVVEHDKQHFISTDDRNTQKRPYEPLIQIHDETDVNQETLHSVTDVVLHGLFLALGYEVK